MATNPPKGDGHRNGAVRGRNMPDVRQRWPSLLGEKFSAEPTAPTGPR
ncbi:MAG: hypothetical protein AAF662_00215 [Pseudomonadota bacterium]